MPREFVKRAFLKNGVFIWPNFISSEKAKNLRDLVLDLANFEAALGEEYIYPFDTSGRTQRVWNLTNKSRDFRALLELDDLIEMMNFIFDRPTRHQLFFLSSFQANIIHPGAQRQKLHIDTPFPEPIPPWPSKANSIWMLDDFTLRNGATEFLPGSHTLTKKPNQGADQEIALDVAVGSRGSVVFTHGNLWHRAGANNSELPRVALLCSFAASYMKEIASEEDQSLILSSDTKRDLSEKLKLILGIGHGIKGGALVEHNGRN